MPSTSTIFVTGGKTVVLILPPHIFPSLNNKTPVTVLFPISNFFLSHQYLTMKVPIHQSHGGSIGSQSPILRCFPSHLYYSPHFGNPTGLGSCKPEMGMKTEYLFLVINHSITGTLCRVKERGLTRSQPYRQRSWTSGLQNSKKTNFCGLSPPVCGVLLWQPKQTNIACLP